MGSQSRKLTEDEIAGSISKIVFGAVWDWTSRHRHHDLFPEGTTKHKLKPTIKRDALRLGEILCRGIVATQRLDKDPNWKAYQYEFMLGANLISSGGNANDLEFVQSLYFDLKSDLRPAQAYHLLSTLLDVDFKSKQKYSAHLVDLVLVETLQLVPDDEPLEYTLYSLWQNALNGRFGVEISPERRSQLLAKVDSLKDTRTARRFAENSKQE